MHSRKNELLININKNDVKKQFLLDVSRLVLIVDNIEIPRNGDSSIAWELIHNKIKNAELATRVAYFVTQTSLADFYIKETMSDIFYPEREFILDNGNHIIIINTNSNKLSIKKHFRKVYLYKDFVFEMGEYIFILEYNFISNSILYYWNKEFDDTILIEYTKII